MTTLVLTNEALEEGRVVIDPVTNKKVAERGVRVRKITSYWKNRITDKDVEIQKATETKKVSK